MVLLLGLLRLLDCCLHIICLLFRHALSEEFPDMMKLRNFLSGIVSLVNTEWRIKRKEIKDADLKENTGIDTAKWVKTLPEEIQHYTNQILDSLGGEDALEKFSPVIKALHEIIPDYPLLHWRHLHKNLRERVRAYYQNGQYGDAASQSILIYCEIIRNLTGLTTDGTELVNGVFGGKPFITLPRLQLNDLSTDSKKNIQEGQGHLSRGVVTGFRNPITHGPMDTNVPAVFSELDCLNVLSMVSYLMTRLDKATVNP